MCTFNLTLIPTCKHELPTLTYCPKASTNVSDYNRKQKLGIRNVKPAKTCTNSAGWRMYRPLDAPVECGTCIEWLEREGKRTYGGVKRVGEEEEEAEEEEGDGEEDESGGEDDESGGDDDDDDDESEEDLSGLLKNKQLTAYNGRRR